MCLFFASVMFVGIILLQPDYIFRQLILATGTQTEGIITQGKYTNSKYTHEYNVYLQFTDERQKNHVSYHDINWEDYERILKNNPHEGDISEWKLKSSLKVHVYYLPALPTFFTIKEYSASIYHVAPYMILLLLCLGIALYSFIYPE